MTNGTVPPEPAQAFPPGAPDWPPPGEVTKDERTTAMLSWLLAILTGLLGPLIMFLIKKDESRFVRFHALQAVFFGLVVAGAALVLLVFAFVVGMLTCGLGFVLAIPLFLVLIALNLTVSIMWCVKANDGKWDPVPVVGNWAKG